MRRLPTTDQAAASQNGHGKPWQPYKNSTAGAAWPSRKQKPTGLQHLPHHGYGTASFRGSARFALGLKDVAIFIFELFFLDTRSCLNHHAYLFQTSSFTQPFVLTSDSLGSKHVRNHNKTISKPVFNKNPGHTLRQPLLLSAACRAKASAGRRRAGSCWRSSKL